MPPFETDCLLPNSMEPHQKKRFRKGKERLGERRTSELSEIQKGQGAARDEENTTRAGRRERKLRKEGVRTNDGGGA